MVGIGVNMHDNKKPEPPQYNEAYKRFSRAIIENALANNDREFFLNSSTIFGICARLAKLDDKTLQQYAEKYLVTITQKWENPHTADPLRFVFPDGHIEICETTGEAESRFKISAKAIHRAKWGKAVHGHTIRTLRYGNVEVYRMKEVTVR